MAKKAATAKPTKPSLFQVAESASKSGKAGCRSWLDALDEDQRRQVIDFAIYFTKHGGNRSAVVAAWRDAGLDVSKNKFDALLDKVARGELK